MFIYNFRIIDLNLSQLRMLLEKSQTEIAEMLEISKQLYSLKELGKVNFKEIEIKKLVEYFNISYKNLEIIINNKKVNKIKNRIEGVKNVKI